MYIYIYIYVGLGILHSAYIIYMYMIGITCTEVRRDQVDTLRHIYARIQIQISAE